MPVRKLLIRRLGAFDWYASIIALLNSSSERNGPCQNVLAYTNTPQETLLTFHMVALQDWICNWAEINRANIVVTVNVAKFVKVPFQLTGDTVFRCLIV